MQTDYTELAPDFMGRVLNRRHGDGFAAAQRELLEGEGLFFLHDQLIKMVPVPVTDQASFDASYQQYLQGLSVSYQLVAAPQPVFVTVIVQEEDEGPIEVKSGWLKG